MTNQITTFSIRHASKLVGFENSKLFFKWLKKYGYLLPDNQPAPNYIELNWFILTTKIIYQARPPFAIPVTRVTLKGIAELKKAMPQKNTSLLFGSNFQRPS